MTQNARLVIVCGLPGSGKTTLARQLESAIPALRISADDWMNELSINLHAEDSRAKIEAIQWQLIKRLLRLGETVIVEWGAWSKSDRTRLRNEAHALGAAVELHCLLVPLEELFKRIQRRGAENPPVTWEALQEWGRHFEPPSSDELALFEQPLRSSDAPREVIENPHAFEIRRFELVDRAAIQNIRKRAFQSIYTSWRELLGEAVFDIEYGNFDQRQADHLDSICKEDSAKEVYVLFEHTRIVGFIALSVEGDGMKGEIDLNAVDPDLQGNGAGTYLYTFGVARLKEKGASLAKVGTGLDAAHYRARRAYERAGFTMGVPGVTMFQLLSPQ